MFDMKPSARQMRTFAGLRRIVETLRGPDGCPWDKVQTHESLRPYLLEETYEALDALDEHSPEHLCEELGDLLLELLLHVQIAEERGDFTLDDVIFSVSDKLVRRHPHVFGEAVATTPEAVVEQWDTLKATERGDRSAMDGLPLGLPALAQAQAIQRRASRAGFRFETVEQVWASLEEELSELREAETAGQRAKESGDAMFALANVARWYEVDAEDSLRQTARAFIGRFRAMETLAAARAIDLDKASIEQKMALWDEAKSAERNPHAD
jgi:tetrapyrrole methylase family protein/MazG family protein